MGFYFTLGRTKDQERIRRSLLIDRILSEEWTDVALLEGFDGEPEEIIDCRVGSMRIRNKDYEAMGIIAPWVDFRISWGSDIRFLWETVLPCLVVIGKELQLKVFAEDIVMTGHNNGDVMGLFSGGKGWASGLLGTIEEKMIE